MRKLFNIFLFVLCIVAIAGCNDTESSEFKLEIKAVNTNFQATGGKGYIQLQSTGNITADVDVDWCVLKEVNPNEVVFEVKENTGYSGRNALLTISNGIEKKAFNIGLFQCIAMIPGVSRSMATIVGGMAQKLTRKDAAEFSFFLAVPTMFAATGYKVLKLFLDGGTEILVNNMPALIIGNVVAFVVALLAIKFFISFVTKYGFKAFGWYRIIVGGTILVMLLLGYNLEIG